MTPSPPKILQETSRHPTTNHNNYQSQHFYTTRENHKTPLFSQNLLPRNSAPPISTRTNRKSTFSNQNIPPIKTLKQLLPNTRNSLLLNTTSPPAHTNNHKTYFQETEYHHPPTKNLTKQHEPTQPNPASVIEKLSRYPSNLRESHGTPGELDRYAPRKSDTSTK